MDFLVSAEISIVCKTPPDKAKVPPDMLTGCGMALVCGQTCWYTNKQLSLGQQAKISNKKSIEEEGKIEIVFNFFLI